MLYKEKFVRPSGSALKPDAPCQEFGSFSDLHAVFGVPRSSAYLHLKRGNFRSRLIGGRRLIDFQSVREFFANAPENPSLERLRLLKKAARASVKARKANAATKQQAVD
jgi:hypothetical protein